MQYNEKKACGTIQTIIDVIVKNCPPEGVIVESGTFTGITAAFLVKKLQKAGKTFRIHTIDNFLLENVPLCEKTNGYDDYIKNITDWEVIDNITTIVSDSLIAIDAFQDNSIYCVILDDLHEYGHVKKQIEKWLPKIINGGLLIGDDWAAPDVRNAFIEVFGSLVQPTSCSNGCIVYINRE